VDIVEDSVIVSDHFLFQSTRGVLHKAQCYLITDFHNSFIVGLNNKFALQYEGD